MGRDLSYVIIESEEHLRAYNIYQNVKFRDDYSELTDEVQKLLNKYSYEEYEIYEGRNGVEWMSDRFFTLENLHEFIEECLSERDYRQVYLLSKIANETEYGVIISSS